MSGVEESRRQVVTATGTWTETWAELHANVNPTPEVPDIDFDTHRVIVVAMGARLEREIEPGPDCLTTQAITRPAMAVAVPAADTPVVFEEERVVRLCG